MFTHQGNDLAKDISEIICNPPDLKPTEKSKDYLKNMILTNDENREQMIEMPRYVKDKRISPLCWIYISETETEDAIKTINENKAMGLDDIPPALISNTTGIGKNEIFIKTLTSIHNLIWEKGIYPSDLKKDRIIIINKKGDKMDPGNFRLIAVHSPFRKILNRY